MMNKFGIKKKLLIVTIIVIILAIPVGVYGYSYTEYKNNYKKISDLVDEEKYEEAISQFTLISKTYFGKKNIEELNRNINEAKKLDENKVNYNEALSLLNENKYIEAIDCFQKIPKEDLKRYTLAENKIEESKTLYTESNIEIAKSEATDGKYESAISYLTLVLHIDNINKKAIALKEEYNITIQENKEKALKEAEEKVRLEAEEKVRLEAQEKARLEAEEKARLVAEEKVRLEALVKSNSENEVTLAVDTNKNTTFKVSSRRPPSELSKATKIPVQAQGVDEIKTAFQNMGFEFSSDTNAEYNKYGVSATLSNKNQYWELLIKTWYCKGSEETLAFDCMVVISGEGKARDGMITIDGAYICRGEHVLDLDFDKYKISSYADIDLLTIHIFIN